VDRTRREALQAVLSGAAVAEFLGLSCSRDDTAPHGTGAATPHIALPLGDVPEGERVTVVVDGLPVELLRRGPSVTARSLRCTHQGCVVRWKEGEAAYVCPCHEGRYDANGNVLAGPPPAPLRRVRAAVLGTRVLVGRK